MRRRAGRGAAWTEERGASDEGRRRLKGARKASGEQSVSEPKGARGRAGDSVTKVAISRALISVYDKTGLEDLARALHQAGVEIVSTGSTAAAIPSAAVPVTAGQALTGFPHGLDGPATPLPPPLHPRPPPLPRPPD